MSFTTQVDGKWLARSEAEWVSEGLVAQLNVKALLVDVNGAPVSGGGGAWGDITGTLSAQTDLQSALDAKIGSTAPLVLSANDVDQRNGATAQVARGRHTYTDGSNSQGWKISTTSTAVIVAAETAGTGADDVDVILSPAGAGRLKTTSAYLYFDGQDVTTYSLFGNTTSTYVNAANSGLFFSLQNVVQATFTPGLLTYADALHVAVGTTTGTKFGTATAQKMGWWNATPVVQQVLATGVGATADNIITLLQTLGLCKQS